MRKNTEKWGENRQSATVKGNSLKNGFSLSAVLRAFQNIDPVHCGFAVAFLKAVISWHAVYAEKIAGPAFPERRMGLP